MEPNIFDKISEKRIDFLKKYVVKDIAVLIENYIRYDWFNVVAETILLNICVPNVNLLSEKGAARLQKQTRNRLIKNFNQVLKVYKVPCRYPLERFIHLLDTMDGEGLAQDSLEWELCSIRNFNKLLYIREEENERNCMIYDITNIIINSGLDKLSTMSLYINSIVNHCYNNNTNIIKTYARDIIWPSDVNKLEFFTLPDDDDEDIDSDDYDSDDDYEEEEDIDSEGYGSNFEDDEE